MWQKKNTYAKQYYKYSGDTRNFPESMSSDEIIADFFSKLSAKTVDVC